MTITSDTRNADRLRWWERKFLDALAIRPVVTTAAALAGINARTAYLHRQDSPRFAAAWDDALELAHGGLETKAYDMANDGDGPMLRWILSRRKPAEWGNPGKTAAAGRRSRRYRRRGGGHGRTRRPVPRRLRPRGAGH